MASLFSLARLGLRFGCLCALSLFAIFFAVRPVSACNVPVFRYALERWPAGRFEVVGFHKGEIGKDQHTALKLLANSADTEPPAANLKIETVDLDRSPTEELLDIFQSLKAKELPVIAVRYPAAGKPGPVCWTGSLSIDKVKTLLDSPARQKIADELLQGTSAVWLFLKSGDSNKDEAAAELLTKHVPHLEKTLKLPKLTDDPEDQLDTTLPLKLKFSLLALDRKDPAEAAFVEMLLKAEALTAAELKEPMVFPVFGRGRALPALIGAGITADNLREHAGYVIGRCTCKVKEQNPGFDLLMSVSWDSRMGEKLVKEGPGKPLGGIAKIKLPKISKGLPPDKEPTQVALADGKESGGTAKKSNPADPGMSALPEGHTPSAEPSNSSTRPNGDAGLFRNTLYAVAAGVCIVVIVYVVTRVRGRRGA